MIIFISAFLIGIFYQYTSFSTYVVRLISKLGIPTKPTIRGYIYKLVAGYLLLRIGLVGGVELAAQELGTILLPSVSVVGLSVSLCLLALKLLSFNKMLDKETRVSLATHFGSVSVGTFAAAVAFLEGSGIPYNPMVNTWIALMELPSVLVGIMMLGQGIRVFQHLLKEDKNLLILPAALITGAVVGPQLLHASVSVILFETAFEPVLVYFLFEMGRQAGTNLRNLGENRLTLVTFGVGMPILGSTLGIAVSKLIGLDLGDTMILGTLSASLSYIAAPTAMEAAITALSKDRGKAQKAVSTSLTVSLGIALPFNILFGLRVYLWQAQLPRLTTIIIAFLVVLCALWLASRERKSLVYLGSKPYKHFEAGLAKTSTDFLLFPRVHNAILGQSENDSKFQFLQKTRVIKGGCTRIHIIFGAFILVVLSELHGLWPR